MTKKHRDFAQRLINALIRNGHTSLRTPSGVCMKTLAKFSGASEQICRRYIRGDALPDYGKITNIAQQLSVAPGWLLFGETTPQKNNVDDDLLHYLLMQSFLLYQSDQNANAYANFVLKLLSEVRDITTSKENLRKIIELAVGSISYKENQKKQAV